MDPHAPQAAVCTARVEVTVTDLPGVQRVLTLLTGRNYTLIRFEAEEAGSGRWRVRVDSAVPQRDQIELLGARLQRMPSVLTVDAAWSGLPAGADPHVPSAGTAVGEPSLVP
jgi:hypothetical protein